MKLHRTSTLTSSAKIEEVNLKIDALNVQMVEIRKVLQPDGSLDQAEQIGDSDDKIVVDGLQNWIGSAAQVISYAETFASERSVVGTEIGSQLGDDLKKTSDITTWAKGVSLDHSKPTLEREHIDYWLRAARHRMELLPGTVSDGEATAQTIKIYTEAEAYLKKVMENTQRDSEWRDEALEMLANVYYGLKKWQDVGDILQEQEFNGRATVLEGFATSYATYANNNNKDDDGAQFLRTLEQIDTILLTQQFERREVALETFAIQYVKHGNYSGGQSFLLELELTGAEPSLPISQAKHSLAEYLFTQKKFDEAENWCRQAEAGRKRPVNTGKSSSYYQSVHLLAQIYEAKGDSLKAEACRSLLPWNFQCILIPILCFY